MTEEAIIKIAGIDAEKFLQGQLTINLPLLKPDILQLAAHCNPHGRIISLGYLTIHEGDYYFLIPHDMLEIATSALKKYAVFFKVTLSSVPLTSLPIKPPGQLEKIQRGIPSIYAKTSGLFLPHELNLHLLNAIDFAKGCYTGQEIIARMQYRGKLKKHLYRAQYKNTVAPLPGSDVLAPNGTIVDAVQVRPEQCLILLVCDENDVKNHHLLLTKGNQHDVTFID